ncbi:MAG TPA: UDP-N-acetylglucosamine 1-carboxyvinyltransferase, partial [Tenuifilum sp.]|nr:UDP-N-acetylglucosamine 1-carboxyvinyltransferase [Tenuifilum sp.]
MATFEVYGGKPLKGELHPQGAKNEALQIICATLLTAEPVTIKNIPNIRDVNKLIELLQGMGVEVQRHSSSECTFRAKNVDVEYLTTNDFKVKAAAIRGSIMVVGPLLARYGRAYAPKPGGDKIGRRRLDTHFLGFQKLGATFNFDTRENFFTLEGKNMRGAYMLLDEASVTGTANILMAAVLTSGTTTIYNAACEPYLQQLSKMLVSMGAKISGIGSNLLTVEGV